VRIKFSQPTDPETKNRIKSIIRKIKRSRSCPDLLVKVFFYRKERKGWRGNFRSIEEHGFYDHELEYYPPITTIITLKLGDKDDETIRQAFAHEFAHYLIHKRAEKQRERLAKKIAERLLRSDDVDG